MVFKLHYPMGFYSVFFNPKKCIGKEISIYNIPARIVTAEKSEEGNEVIFGCLIEPRWYVLLEMSVKFLPTNTIGNPFLKIAESSFKTLGGEDSAIQ